MQGRRLKGALCVGRNTNRVPTVGVIEEHVDMWLNNANYIASDVKYI